MKITITLDGSVKKIRRALVGILCSDQDLGSEDGGELFNQCDMEAGEVLERAVKDGIAAIKFDDEMRHPKQLLVGDTTVLPGMIRCEGCRAVVKWLDEGCPKCGHEHETQPLEVREFANGVQVKASQAQLDEIDEALPRRI